ncbi:hypothetical protein EJ05DRAFT_481416 [Pseudovirgaria hyperparasitica]|uniref:SGNH hydrolase-type esterase domain-containing protein n=1 Tax=Pseudovirgaria hyperparasitica TaxID=470096 RepID=A0A6A6WI55_9PEZI|nr:uncharacterized protein EJ05DRAFT_481416 [Pseudovirgaria hyperparasitica]KAF2762482.1 hypothetical protein EJ05DRAFT_481416 [Pseudovirgaria hyperparasitica]
MSGPATTPSDAGITISSENENQEISRSQMHKLLVDNAKWKQRSEETSSIHIADLKKLSPNDALSTVLLGDSMFERMKTTGQSASLEPWPSTEMLGGRAFNQLKATNPLFHKRLDGVFNTGVGGDGVQNIVYRLAGEKAKNLDGLLPTLGAHNIKLFVLHCGTNNLHHKQGLKDRDRDYMRLILQALLHIARAGSKILVTGLFYRNDISDELVDDANGKIQDLVNSMNENIGALQILYLAPAPKVCKEHLVDHVHLSIDGYRLWTEHLLPKVVELLREVDLLRKAARSIHENAEQELFHSLKSSGSSSPL